MKEENAVKKFLEENNLHELNIKAALIDMDGVLYDTMKYHTLAWHKMATELEIKCERDEFYLYEGMTGAATINLLFKRAFGREVSKEEAKELYAVKVKYFTENGKVEMMRGADRMLNCLRDNNVMRVLVTGSGQHTILDRITHDYPNIFDEDKRVTAHDVKHGKPHPEPYLMGMAKAGCKPEECIVVENAPLGIESGKAAECFVVGITTGPIPKKTMVEAGADIIYNSMDEFADALPLLLKSIKKEKI